MISYAILNNPGHNRVYFEESKSMAINEIKIVGARLSAKLENISSNLIAGIPYTTFDAGSELTESDMKALARLSFVYAIFKISGKSLIPIEMPGFMYIDQKIGSILKYTGKTNEIFTRMLINIAVYSSDFYNDPNIGVLDPIAGKGTTLFESLICGHNAYGIEIGDRTVLESYHFFVKYLEKEKYKHHSAISKISGQNKSFSGTKYSFKISRTKEEEKNKIYKELEIVSGNSLYADTFYPKKSVEIIAGDLPYGVRHSNVTNENQSSFTRNPRELLEKCLPSWKEVLKKNGVIALSWNAFVLSRKEIAGILENNGFRIFTGDVYENFEHRVDQAIKRDVIAAKKQ